MGSPEKKTKKEQQQVPEDVLLSDVFIKLPAKSVLGLKPVRKSWYSSIKNPKFVERFHANSFNRPDGTCLLLTTYNELSSRQYFISSSTDESLDKAHVSLLCALETDSELCVSQNVNGMFCVYPPAHLTFYQKSVDYVYVFNPSTRELLAVPCLPNPPSKIWPGINLNMISYFFGFDVGSKEYKVLGVCCNVSNVKLRVSGEVECGIFTLGSSRAWRVVKVPVPVTFDPNTPAVCVNGAIHWLIKDKRVILAFDLALEVFRLIKLEDGIGIGIGMGVATLSYQLQGVDDGNQYVDYDDEDEDMDDDFQEESRFWPCLIQVGNYLAVLEYDDDELRMSVLKDYQNEQWVTESMDYPYDWNLMHAMPCGSSHATEFFLCLNYRAGYTIPQIVCCNMERSSYREINFGEQIGKIDSSTVSVSLVGCYPENIMPLPKI